MNISPFAMSEIDGSYSVTLDAGEGYLEDIFALREDEGLLPNGYGWEALAMAYIEECCPDAEELLEFDSEADMFCVYCDEEEVLAEFITGFKAACDNRDRIKKILEKADPDNF